MQYGILAACCVWYVVQKQLLKFAQGPLSTDCVIWLSSYEEEDVVSDISGQLFYVVVGMPCTCGGCFCYFLDYSLINQNLMR